MNMSKTMVKIFFLVVFWSRHTNGFSPVLQQMTSERVTFSSAARYRLRAVSPEFDEVCDTTGVTLTRFMQEVENVNPELSELAQLISGIQTASKAISNLVKRSQLPSSSVLGLEGAINVQGEDQKKLDVITNDVLKRALKHTGTVGVVASEEEDTPMNVMSERKTKDVIYDEGSSYVTVFDPLDGSSNVDAGIPTGTIFGIFHHDESCDISAFLDAPEDSNFNMDDVVCMVNTLQPGNNLAAAGYVLYSSSTFLTLTIGSGVYGFTLDEQIGEFVLSHPCIQLPDEMNIMSFNEANWDLWDEPMQNVHERWRTGKSKLGKRYTSRYVGSMVADVHRTLLYGGVFGYPSDSKNVNGKLRLLYEAAPMSFLIEQAGGLSTTGRERIMDLTPENVHQRVPVVMGSKTEVQEVIDEYEKFHEGQ
mmetsp:Transcript_4513/g.5532  ORF Transcript_4513/g.5532 Transcript_4513/m.5532 type:complete len:420 (-) Transcript_4513:700-1959(-)|eukprot:CAMPEP_0203642794 /NCGR_PEP_ID=MMETSP0088-20131115/8190_1 /ASSEMBLY_ACC=CAM_ASM_001087 /TAXON_ID=426623 /ORGANISM="Chaetoceros affinis, Strain CCMP159" /LENGTH=419 /DNA_ID=CAMNT_0050498741 /DNA_START=31 /DNA_END=1290 /DNA_ORIENTATION=-